MAERWFVEPDTVVQFYEQGPIKYTMIPPHLLQKTKDPIPQYVLDQFCKWLPNNWKHIIFTGDKDALQYLEENAGNEYPNIADKFYSFTNGAHRADIFRIFWLWQNGGIYLDSDIMLAVPITKLFKSNTQFLTTSSQKECSIGFMGSTPRHPVMKYMLDLMYNIDPNVLEKDYFYVCKKLYKHLINSNLLGIRVYIEVTDDDKGIAEVRGNEVLAYHYYKYKVIPNTI